MCIRDSIIACRIENSPIADSRFASQKVSVQQKINQLFFEHFKGKMCIRDRNNVVGFSQLLSTDNELDEEERKEYSCIIQANSGELIQLVNDVLDLSLIHISTVPNC